MPNMDIVVEDLDLGYDQCKDLSTLANSQGAKLLDEFKSNIAQLKEHWIASDATEHINALIKVATALGTLLGESTAYTATAADGMIALQELRNSNGGGGKIGEPLKKEGPQTPNIAEVPPTKEYRCDKAHLGQDLETLISIGDSFDSFTATFNEDADSLLLNWKEGANHPNAEACFRRFAEDAESYKSLIAAAKDNLSTAVTNINRI